MEIKKSQIDKCPYCGSSDILYDEINKKLLCKHCRKNFLPQTVLITEEEIKNLEGEVINSGISKINKESDDIVTLKCSSCGAETEVNSQKVLKTFCPWCRSKLSINTKVENGAVPDYILPFSISKEEALKRINKYLSKRKFFASKKFKRDMDLVGIYLPYVVVDSDYKCFFEGYGEKLTNSRKVKVLGAATIVYDADVFKVSRDFKTIISGQTLETKEESLNLDNYYNSNNILNSIMPFDTENMLDFKASYMNDYIAKKRNVEVESFKHIINKQSNEIIKDKLADTILEYDRGVRWETRDIKIEGRNWKSSYFPVWLYTYNEKTSKKIYPHYVVVNGRTGEANASVPLNKFRLNAITFTLFLILSLLNTWVLFNRILIDLKGMPFEIILPEALLYIVFSGSIIIFITLTFYGKFYHKYRNYESRHIHEEETETKIYEMIKKDEFTSKSKDNSRKEILSCNSKPTVKSRLNNSKYKTKY